MNFNARFLTTIVLGWSVPFVWAAVMTFISIEMTKSMCKRENEMEVGR